MAGVAKYPNCKRFECGLNKLLSDPKLINYTSGGGVFRKRARACQKVVREGIKNKSEHPKWATQPPIDYKDEYRLLVYKALASLNWVMLRCMQVPWTLHADDDILIDVFALAKVLQSVDANSTEKFLCHSGTSPVLRKGKWSVDVAEYPALEYPYYCAGGMWILQTKQIPRLLEASKVAPFLWVDDVYICGILREHAGIKQMHLNDKYTFEFNITHLGKKFAWLNAGAQRQMDWIAILDYHRNISDQFLLL
nr:acetylgalactosaminyl-O-glycosyl-glycoprotein beta-1,3-N-acetylglucosaminyltransferase-like [Penaeus vannamei]